MKNPLTFISHSMNKKQILLMLVACLFFSSLQLSAEHTKGHPAGISHNNDKLMPQEEFTAQISAHVYPKGII